MNVDALSIQTYNDIGGDQYNFNFENAGPSIPPPPLQPFINAPDILSIHFTGRTEDLVYIKETFDAISDDVPIRCVIHGMPGIGKSQLTLYFAISSFKQRRYLYVFWISATTIARLHEGYNKLLNLVDHRDRGDPNQETRLTAARRWLEQCETKWLLVVDNVGQDTLGFLQEHLPFQGKHGNILFTTRTKSVADSLANSGGQRHQVLALRIPNLQDATKLLLDCYEGEVDDKQTSKAQDIVNSVGRLPLAVAQASAFIKESGKSLDAILKLYESDQKLEMINWKNDLSTYEAKSVAATFSHQLQDLEARYPSASILLHILSFLDPESIPLNMIVQGAEIIRGAEKTKLPSLQRIMATFSKKPDFSSVLGLIRSPIELQSAITQLQNRSLVQLQRDSGTPTLYMHDLVQFMVQVDVKKGGALEHWYDLTVRLVSAFANIEDPELPQSWSDFEACLPHIRSLSTRQEMCGRTTWSLLMTTNESLSEYLTSHRRYDESEKALDKVLMWKEKKFGSQHIYTMRTLNRLGTVYMLQGKYVPAETMLGRVLAAQEKHLGVEQLDTLITMNNLAAVYESQGRYDAAETMHERVLTAKEKHFGIEHPRTLTTMNNLACVYRSQGHYDAAKTMLERVLVAREKHLGIEHPETFIIMNNLAEVYESQGHYDAAESMLERVIAAEEKHFGVEHPRTLTTMNNLAASYKQQGRYDDAETMLKCVLAAHEKHLGVEHPDTLISMSNLAEVYQSQGRRNAAETLLGRVLAAREKHLGVEHLETLSTINSMAVLYRSQGRYDAAETMHKRVVAVREKHLGIEHPDTLNSMNNLALVYQSQDLYDAAEAMLERVLATQKKVLGVEHPDTLISMNNLATVYQSQGRHNAAETLLGHVLAAQEKHLGIEHPGTLTTMNNLAFVFQSQDRYESAKTMHERVLAVEEKLFGSEHPDTLFTMNNLVLAYVSQGRYDVAETMQGRLLAAQEKHLGIDHPDTLDTTNNLGFIYKAQNRFDDAEAMFKRTLAGREKCLGVDHIKTLEVLGDLSQLYRAQGRLVDAEMLASRAGSHSPIVIQSS